MTSVPPPSPAHRNGWLDRKVIGWALYDWGNSAFATTVMAGFFPVFYKQHLRGQVEPTTSTFELGLFNALASLAVVLMAPALGAIADLGRTKKPMLAAWAGIGILATAGLGLAGDYGWLLAGSLYALGVVGFSASNIFYDAMIISVAEGRRTDAVSAFGFALGYLGGGLLFALNVLMTLKPGWFGLPDSAAAVRVSFLTVAAWWALFSLPLLVLVPERAPRQGAGWATAARMGIVRLVRTIAGIRGMRNIALFLVAYYFYIDGVSTIIKMAVDYGLALGFPARSLILALLLVQFVGFPAAIAFGWLGERFGTRRAILTGLAIYVGITVWGVAMRDETDFYLLAVAVGCVQGGVQSLSRSMFARLIPQRKSAELFGFYNMMGKFATLLGPILVGVTARVSGSSRLSLLSIIILFLAGGALLLCVRERSPAGEALVS
ncbi:MAG: MFS transporter [Candidatus Sumerlaeaceae bacterium]|nr:MFS transporter [Candidatus Sumerlaeaceae bacterium]